MWLVYNVGNDVVCENIVLGQQHQVVQFNKKRKYRLGAWLYTTFTTVGGTSPDANHYTVFVSCQFSFYSESQRYLLYYFVNKSNVLKPFTFAVNSDKILQTQSQHPRPAGQLLLGLSATNDNASTRMPPVITSSASSQGVCLTSSSK